MSYPIPSKLWQRVSILLLILLIPSVGTAIFRQSWTVTALANQNNSSQTIPVNHPEYKALQTLVKNYSCLVSVPHFEKLPINRTEFANILNACISQINQLSNIDSSLVSKADQKILESLKKEFAPELATLNIKKGEFADSSDTVTAEATRQRKVSVGVIRGNQSTANMPLNSIALPMMAKPISPQNRRALPEPEIRTKFNTENYNRIDDNPFKIVRNQPLSTFSIDVDTASYSNVRRFINQGQLPPKDAVRIEELVNYFSYDYPQPQGERPFSVTTEVTKAPWNPQHKLVQVGLQGKSLETKNLPPSNLVFLIDVSGSMGQQNKLPLVQRSLKLLVNKLRPEDKVTLVVYAGNAGLVLPPTSGDEKSKIITAIDRLRAGGSTAGGEGIELAYRIAKQNFLKSGNNRVILATDGDFNVGVSSDAELTRLIEQKREQGIFLTVLGFGTGNYKDGKMEQLANQGNGNYAYIDTLSEANKVLVHDIRGTLFTIAKDVKIQVEFNPQKVQAYRLIGYENRVLENQDFNDDKKDAGEIGSGHSVTALYEVIPTGVESNVKLPSVDPLRYQNVNTPNANNDEIMLVKLRYKSPQSSTSKLITQTIKALDFQAEKNPSNDIKFASAVATFGMILRDSEYKGNANYNLVKQLANSGKGEDSEGYRSEFIRLVSLSQAIDN
ncbi:MAG: VWA domain-containing protein [Sphaerospermopsis sp. SIO1G1]|nr:VWA domain-containing protein [Sphaerospermopsis sp. SIO1G1]